MGTSMTSRFLKAGHVRNYSLPSLKIIFCGGAILKLETQRELRHLLPHVQILQGYGKYCIRAINYQGHSIDFQDNLLSEGMI